MDPLDRVRAGLDGIVCAVCNDSVPVGSIQLLAHRDALAFVQLECSTCRSTTLAFVLDGDGREGPRPAGGPVPAGHPTGAPVTADDVLDMHVFLREWRGGVAGLFGPTGADSASR
jgi:hypothetical protein